VRTRAARFAEGRYECLLYFSVRSSVFLPRGQLRRTTSQRLSPPKRLGVGLRIAEDARMLAHDGQRNPDYFRVAARDTPGWRPVSDRPEFADGEVDTLGDTTES
jgi:hypothetical protein